MSQETTDNTKENTDILLEEDQKISRRSFISASTGAAIAAGSIGLMGAVSSANAAVAPPPLESPDTSVRWKAKRGDLYNEKLGYGDEDVTGYAGRAVYGATVGILQLPANIPMLPGDMGNPTTFDFPVLYELIEEIDPFWVLATEPHPVVMEKLIAACKRLTVQGVTTIIGNCGFFANYQPEVSISLDPGVQFFNGSLVQVPMLLNSVGANKKVGVLTASAELLIPSPALKYSGVSDEEMSRVVIFGNENGTEMKRITEETGSFNPKKLEQELVNLAKDMVKKHPDIGAVVLECTEFPPYAHAIQDAIRLNVWDFVTLTNFMHAGAMRKPYTGWVG